MTTVSIERNRLLEILRENRANHQDVFEEAIEGYRTQATDWLNRQLDRVKVGKPLEYMPYQIPKNQTKQYNIVIQMLEMTEDDTVKLGEREFNEYVNDDWDWKKQWLTSNSNYSKKAADMIEEEED